MDAESVRIQPDCCNRLHAEFQKRAERKSIVTQAQDKNQARGKRHSKRGVDRERRVHAQQLGSYESDSRGRGKCKENRHAPEARDRRRMKVPSGGGPIEPALTDRMVASESREQDGHDHG